MLLGLSLASGQLLLGFFLEVISESAAVPDALSAYTETHIDFWKWLVDIIEAVLATPGILEVHDIEFFVQERVKP